MKYVIGMFLLCLEQRVAFFMCQENLKKIYFPSLPLLDFVCSFYFRPNFKILSSFMDSDAQSHTPFCTKHQFRQVAIINHYIEFAKMFDDLIIFSLDSVVLVAA